MSDAFAERQGLPSRPRGISISELADLLARDTRGFEAAPHITMGVPPVDFPAANVGPTDFAAVPRGAAFPIDDLVSFDAIPAAPRHFEPAADVERASQWAPHDASGEDPLRASWRAGFEDGVATEKRVAQEMRGEDTLALSSIAQHMRLFDDAAITQLESRLRDTVLLLCRQVIADYDVPPDVLAVRVSAAARLLADASDLKIALHPRDAALVAPHLPQGWVVQGDEALNRGALRVSGPSGGIEDGPGQWLAALEEAVRTC